MLADVMGEGVDRIIVDQIKDVCLLLISTNETNYLFLAWGLNITLTAYVTSILVIYWFGLRLGSEKIRSSVWNCLLDFKRSLLTYLINLSWLTKHKTNINNKLN